MVDSEIKTGDTLCVSCLIGTDNHEDYSYKKKRMKKMSEISWSDGLGSRSRRPWLLLLKGEQIVPFKGSNIPGFAVIRGSDYRKNGKWSYTTYRLELADGVRAIAGMMGWETGRFVEGLHSAVTSRNPIDTWADVANALGVSVPAAMSCLREWRPKAAAALDAVDEALDALDEAADAAEADADIETVVISFGSPTRRQRAGGFWVNPKPITGHGGQIRLVESERGWIKENIEVAGMIGSVLSVQRANGHGGGYVTVTVAVVPGTEKEEEVV